MAKTPTVEEAYKMGRTLGQGTFATVRLAQSRTEGTRWAVKIIDREALTQDDEKSLKMEITILQETNHPNIVSVKEVFYTKKTVCLVMDLMSGGELFDRIVSKDHYSEKEGKIALIDIVTALEYCHSKNIVHRDLKPENILYSSTDPEASLKLADFGLAQLLKPNELMNVACGTPGYVAPEVLQGRYYGKEVDMWSVGVILYILLCGFPPFYDENNKALFNQIIHAKFKFMAPYWSDVSDCAKDLVKRLLQVDPKKRLTAAQCLEHDWVKQEASDTKLQFVNENLKSYNARRRFRGVIRAVMFTQKVSSAGGFAAAAAGRSSYSSTKSNATATATTTAESATSVTDTAESQL